MEVLIRAATQSAAGATDVPDAASQSAAHRLEQLLQAHRSVLARMAATFEADRDEREDLIQDIALAVWRALPTFRGECSDRTFLLRIAYNRGLTHRWRRGRRRHAALTEADAVADPAPDSAVRLEQRYQYETLLATIRSLPESLRGVALLRLEDLSLREIAAVLGISENAATVRLSRARNQLRERLREEPA
jgi:RNA polymerase sigma-70 factor (ECF subfamily)